MSAFAHDPALEEVLLEVPGTRDVKQLRKNIYNLARRRGIFGVSVRLDRRVGSGDAVLSRYWVRRCSPLVQLTPSQQAQVFIAVRVNKQKQQDVAERFGVARTTVTSLVSRLSKP